MSGSMAPVEKVDQWTPMSPWGRVQFSGSAEALKNFHAAMELFPGVKYKDGAFQIPQNALSSVGAIAKSLGLKAASAHYVSPPPPLVDWKTVEEQLQAAGEIRPEYLGSWAMAYQKEAVTTGWMKSGIHLWHSTGAGKTFSGIALATSVPGPVLVVTRSAAKIQFSREIDRFTTARSYVLRSSSSVRTRKQVCGQTWAEFFSENMKRYGKAALVSEAWQMQIERFGVETLRLGKDLEAYLQECEEAGRRPWVVCGWESLLDHYEDIRGLLRPTVLLADECHMGKSGKRWDVHHLPHLPDDQEEAEAQQVADKRTADSRGGFIRSTEDGRKMFLPVWNRAAAVARIARVVDKRIALTATPIADRVRDLWSQLDVVEPNCWGSKSEWETRYCNAHQGPYGWDTGGSSNTEELKARLDLVTHIVPAQEAHKHLLGRKRRQSVYIAPEDLARPTPGFAAEMKAAKRRGASAVLECRLAQTASQKRKAVIGMVDDCVGSNQKVVIFTGRRRDCEDLGKALVKARMGKSKNVKVWMAHGDTGAEQRQAIVDEYMAHPGPCVLVGTGHAFGESINLDDTDAAFFVMLPYTPGWLRQWEGRFVRLSMKRNVIIYYVIAEDTVDEHIATILIDKLPSVEAIADDEELAEAKSALSGWDEYESEDDFVDAVLADLDW